MLNNEMLANKNQSLCIAPTALLVLGWRDVCSVFLWYVDGEVYMYSIFLWYVAGEVYTLYSCGMWKAEVTPETINHIIWHIENQKTTQ